MFLQANSCCFCLDFCPPMSHGCLIKLRECDLSPLVRLTFRLIRSPDTSTLRRLPWRSLALRHPIYLPKHTSSTAVPSVGIFDPSSTNQTGRSMRRSMTRYTTRGSMRVLRGDQSAVELEHGKPTSYGGCRGDTHCLLAISISSHAGIWIQAWLQTLSASFGSPRIQLGWIGNSGHSHNELWLQ